SRAHKGERPSVRGSLGRRALRRLLRLSGCEARAAPRDEPRTAPPSARRVPAVPRGSRVNFTSVARLEVDVAVVGSGFSGSLTALCLRRVGRSVVLIERGRHPRFAIGESSTPLANLLIEELADRYRLPRIRPFSKWGTWQRMRPDVAVGLKR